MDRERLEELVQALGAAFDRSPLLNHMNDELVTIRRLTGAAGRLFTIADGASTDGAGGGVVQLNGPSAGQIWKVESIGVSVAGASQAAIVAAYIGANDERNLLPGFFLAALNAGPPARGMMAPPRPGFVPAGTPLLIVVRGAVVSQQGGIAARVQGRVIEEAEISGHLGRTSPPVTIGQT